MKKWEVRTGGDSGKDPNAHDVYNERGGLEVRLPWSQKSKAQLIAAAPDMLAALKWAKEALSISLRHSLRPEDLVDHPGLAQVDAAIAKAEGR